MKKAKKVDNPYEMGRDCVLRGPTMTNCNPRLFSTLERTDLWEEGKRDAELELVQKPKRSP